MISRQDCPSPYPSTYCPTLTAPAHPPATTYWPYTRPCSVNFLMSQLTRKPASKKTVDLSILPMILMFPPFLNLNRFALVNLLTGILCSNFSSFAAASALNGLLCGGMMTVIIVAVQDIFGREDYGHVISYLMFFLGN